MNYFELIVLVSEINGCASIYAFASLVGIPIGKMVSAVGLKSWAIPTVIKKYKSIIKKKMEDKITFLAKTNLNSVEVLISNVLHGSYRIWICFSKWCVKKIWSDKRGNQKFLGLNSQSKILIYF